MNKYIQEFVDKLNDKSVINAQANIVIGDNKSAQDVPDESFVLDLTFERIEQKQKILFVEIKQGAGDGNKNLKGFLEAYVELANRLIVEHPDLHVRLFYISSAYAEPATAIKDDMDKLNRSFLHTLTQLDTRVYFPHNGIAPLGSRPDFLTLIATALAQSLIENIDVPFEKLEAGVYSGKNKSEFRKNLIKQILQNS